MAGKVQHEHTARMMAATAHQNNGDEQVDHDHGAENHEGQEEHRRNRVVPHSCRKEHVLPVVSRGTPPQCHHGFAKRGKVVVLLKPARGTVVGDQHPKV